MRWRCWQHPAATAGKHMVVEKPGARCAAELDLVAESARSTGVLVQVKFIRRYHRAFRKAQEISRHGRA
jgi:predicted dehydrogenase